MGERRKRTETLVVLKPGEERTVDGFTVRLKHVKRTKGEPRVFLFVSAEDDASVRVDRSPDSGENAVDN